MTRWRGPSALRRTVASTSLRVKLVATILLLAAAGLAVAGVATTAELHSYLLGRVDDQLHSATSHIPIFRSSAGSTGPSGGQFISPPSRPPSDRRTIPGQFYIEQFDEAGNPIRTRSAPLSDPSPPKLPMLTLAEVQARGGQPFTVPSESGSTDWRVVVQALPDDSGSVAVATSLSDLDHTVDHLILIEVLIGVVVLVLIGSGGWVLIGRALRPLVTVEHTAAAIAAGDLTQRVPDAPERTEVGRLSLALNGMLAQIERAFAHERASQQQATASEQRMRQFVADASHELRTPLTSIRGFAELYRLGGAPSAEELPTMMRRIEDEASRMGLLVEDLLLLARLDQQRPLERVAVDLLPIARDAVHDASLLAPDRTIDLQVDAGPPPIVTGDAARLRQVVNNLVSNALTHTPPGSPVTVRVATDPDQDIAILEVSDRGPGVPETDAERVFERFYRADTSRSRQAGGSGLGLSIVAGLVGAHGGTVTVNRRDGGGATFRATLPLRRTRP